jgi:hypothetical protein
MSLFGSSEPNADAATADVAASVARDRIADLLAKDLEGPVQEQLAGLVRALDLASNANADWAVRVRNQVAIAMTALETQPPKTEFVAIQLQTIERILEVGRSGFARLVNRWSGDSPLWAAFYGAIASVFLGVYALSIVIYVLEGLIFVEWQSLALIYLAAMAGAFVSVMSRLADFAAMVRANVSFIFLNAMIKPFVAAFLAVTVLALLHSQMVNVAGLSEPLIKGSDNPETARVASLLWIIGFLAGFSERFARDIVSRAEGRLLGNGQAPTGSAQGANANGAASGKSGGL